MENLEILKKHLFLFLNVDCSEDKLVEEIIEKSGFDLEKLREHYNLSLGEKFSFFLKKIKDTNFVVGEDYLKAVSDVYVDNYFFSEFIRNTEASKDFSKNLGEMFKRLSSDEQHFLDLLKRNHFSYPLNYEEFDGLLKLWHSFVEDSKTLSAKEMEELMKDNKKYHSFRFYLPKLKMNKFHGELNMFGQLINNDADKEHLLVSFVIGDNLLKENRIYFRLTGKDNVYDKIEQVFFYEDVLFNNENHNSNRHLTKQEYYLYKCIV